MLVFINNSKQNIFLFSHLSFRTAFFPSFLYHLLVQGHYFSHPVFSILCHVFSQLVLLHVFLYVVTPSLIRSTYALYSASMPGSPDPKAHQTRIMNHNQETGTDEGCLQKIGWPRIFGGSEILKNVSRFLRNGRKTFRCF